ncbi:tetraspanin-11-like [Ctenocephalides felis]|uniref:tetraspanin-11-like n=1 Tax=Ctenocephalides felis TaxID=7515 RepID=UPI000E6E1668|nr:tetraspanin-11-like [Ctenocephalides felis]
MPIFFCCLLIILVAEIAAGAWVYYNADRLEGMVRASVKATVQEEYGIIQSRTITFDAIQKGLHCCGASGPQDWARSRYNGADANSINLKVTSDLAIYNMPPSCCKADVSELVCDQSRKAGITAYLNPVINSSGCIDKLVETIRDHMSWVIGIAIGVAVLELLGLIFSVVLCCAIKRNDRYKA